MDDQNNQNQEPMNENMEQPKQSQPKTSQKPYNLEPNVEAALAYFLTPVTGVLVFMLEPNNKFVRFHAMQSIIFGVALFAAYFVSGLLTAILIGALLLPLVSLGGFVLWLFLMYKAYNNEEWEIPVLGKIARDQIK